MQGKDVNFKNITPAELLVSKFIPSTIDKKLRDKIQVEKEITVKLAMAKTRQDTHDKTDCKEFIPNNEFKQEGAIQKIEK